MFNIWNIPFKHILFRRVNPRSTILSKTIDRWAKKRQRNDWVENGYWFFLWRTYYQKFKRRRQSVVSFFPFKHFFICICCEKQLAFHFYEPHKSSFLTEFGFGLKNVYVFTCIHVHVCYRSTYQEKVV